MKDPLTPDANILCKLGSIVVHVEEMMSNDGYWMDKAALDSLLKQPDVQEWLEAMSEMALVPKKRN